MMFFRELQTQSLLYCWEISNAHVGTDNETWMSVIGRHGIAGANQNGQYLLQPDLGKILSKSI